jgi:hypothetical protein
MGCHLPTGCVSIRHSGGTIPPTTKLAVSMIIDTISPENFHETGMTVEIPLNFAAPKQ